jgi:hypothetical protein
MDPEPDTSLPVQFGILPAAFVLAMVVPVVVFGFLPELIAPWAQQAAAGLFG